MLVILFCFILFCLVCQQNDTRRKIYDDQSLSCVTIVGQLRIVSLGDFLYMPYLVLVFVLNNLFSLQLGLVPILVFGSNNSD